MSDPPLCAHCGDVIGVYEPLIMIVEDVPVATSRAAVGVRMPLAESYYHRDCFGIAREDNPDLA